MVADSLIELLLAIIRFQIIGDRKGLSSGSPISQNCFDALFVNDIIVTNNLKKLPLYSDLTVIRSFCKLLSILLSFIFSDGNTLLLVPISILDLLNSVPFAP